MTVAVVVIVAGRRDHLGRTLDGLSRQTRQPDDVVVVDMRPDRSVADLVSPPARWLPLLRPGVRDGGDDGGPLPLAAARNTGAAAADADHLVFLDVDCVPAADLVARYDEVLTAHPEALACGPVRYLRPDWLDGSEDGLVGLDARSDPSPARPGGPDDAVRFGDDHELFWSLSFGTTRGTWHELGGFDEGYVGYGGEDTDLAFRARGLGVPMAWFGGGTAYHQWHPPTRFDDSRTAEIVANARRFHLRWGTWPMVGWLHELHGRGRVVFDPDTDVLRLVGAG